MKNPQFDLEQFSDINIQRCDSPLAFNMSGGRLTYFAAGLAEEAGEVAGILKKLERGFNNRELKKTQDKFLKKAMKKNPHLHQEQIENKMRDISSEGWEGIWRIDLKRKLVKEMADVFTYLDLIATKAGNLDLFAGVKDKFNEVSTEMGCEQFKIQ